MTDRHAQLSFDGSEYELPIIEPTIGNSGLSISSLRAESGDVTFDPGFANTAGARSTITYINGSTGILQHRGYAIEDLAAKASFLEVAYLLLFGKLPNRAELDEWADSVRMHTLENEEMKRFFDAFPRSAHPMAILSSATNAISTFYEEYHDPTDSVAFRESAVRL
ncbi:MAG: citrate (Si)-synthase, partial [Acidimicrobiia bacterium]|nr:citrate (Si)-synthase [Acidimicrobiia bacterium]